MEAKRIEAEKAAEIRKKTSLILLSAVVATIAVFLVITKIIIPNNKYNAAIELMESGNIIEAYESLVALGDYKDSAEKAESISEQYRTEKLKTAQVGDYVYFGSYEQNNNTSDGAEEIEWLVLDKQDDKILVVSKYGLDAKPYNKEYVGITWEKCTLRSWLNDDFYNAAFNVYEKKAIIQTTVSPGYTSHPENDTVDNVFLLSINEANRYFSSDSVRKCVSTDYAIAQGADKSYKYKVGGNYSCWWWLRSPGDNQRRAAYVYFDGSVYLSGHDVGDDGVCVRPALWINLYS
jgi:hypothetical protein